MGYLRLGTIYKNEQKFNLAIECYSIMLKLQPDQTASILEDIGIAYQSLKNYDKAIEYYNKAIEYYNKEISVDIYFSSVYRRLSNIYLLRNDKQNALNTCDSAISALGRYPEVSNINLSHNYYALGKIYKLIGDTLKEKACYKKAETNFKTLIKNNPQINDFYEELGGFYLDIKDYSNAEKICQIIISNHPEIAESYYNMACIYSNEKNIDKSLEYFKISLEKGYNDYNNISVDTDLTNIRQLPEFKELLKIYFPDKVK